MAISATSWGDTMKRFLLLIESCLLLVAGCLPTRAVADPRDEAAVEWAVATMVSDHAPEPDPQPYACPRCQDTGWITHGDGHRTRCPDCSDGSGKGSPLDTLRDARELIRKGNELADRSKAILDRAERDGKITIDVRLPKPNLQQQPSTMSCQNGACSLVPQQPGQTPVPPQSATSSCTTSACGTSSCNTPSRRARTFWRRNR